MTYMIGRAKFFFRLCYNFRSPKLTVQCHTTMVPMSVLSVTRKKKNQDKGKAKSREEIL
jgi:hypothetical protein